MLLFKNSQRSEAVCVELDNIAGMLMFSDGDLQLLAFTKGLHFTLV